MKNFLIIAVLLLATGVLSAQEGAKKKRAPHPSLVEVEDVAGLPRVLLIGDSISMGYTVPVRKLLEGVANVHRVPANGGPTSRGLDNIDKWLGDGKWDVIHFNWGIHDVKVMPGGELQVEPGPYEENLRKLVAKLQETGAELIWATTTPIPPNLKGKALERRFGSEVEYNKIARGVMRENGIAINDLHGYVSPRFTELQKPNDLHYSTEGSEFLAVRVAAEIEKALRK